jgi:hypothetical protein
MASQCEPCKKSYEDQVVKGEILVSPNYGVDSSQSYEHAVVPVDNDIPTWALVLGGMAAALGVIVAVNKKGKSK